MCRAVIGVFLMHGLNGRALHRAVRKVGEHVGHCRLLAAKQQQREQQGKQWMAESTHGERVRARSASTHPTRHLSRLLQISSRGRSRPMKTSVLTRASPFSQGRSSEEPKII